MRANRNIGIVLLFLLIIPIYAYAQCSKDFCIGNLDVINYIPNVTVNFKRASDRRVPLEFKIIGSGTEVSLSDNDFAYYRYKATDSSPLQVVPNMNNIGDGCTNCIFANVWKFELLGDELDSGLYELFMSTMDDSENVNPNIYSGNKAYHFYIDIDPPLISNIKLNNADYAGEPIHIEVGNKIMLEAIINDDLDNIPETKVTGASASLIRQDTPYDSYTMTNLAGDSYNTSIPILPAGAYELQITAQDNVSNQGTRSIIIEVSDSSAIGIVLWDLEGENLNPTSISPTQIIGYTGNSGCELEVVVLSEEQPDQAVYHDVIPILGTPSKLLDTIGLASSSLINPCSGFSKGSDNIYISDNDQDKIEVGNYIKFSGHNLDFLKRYLVTDIHSGFGPFNTKVTFTPALREFVACSESLDIYTSEYPSGWFNITVGVAEGSNLVWLKANDSRYQQDIKIVNLDMDSRAPLIRNAFPQHGSVINQNRTLIQAELIDNVTGIDQASISMNISGPCSINNLKIEDHLVFENDVVSFDIADTSFCRGEYWEGTYSALVGVRDNLGNKAHLEWSFTIDTTIPSEPFFTVINAFNTSITDWYSHTLDNSFSVKFPLNEHIVIQSANFDGVDVTSDISTVHEYYDFNYDTGSLTADQTYVFRLTAALDDQGTLGSPKTWSINLTIDTVPPQIIDLYQERDFVNSQDNSVTISIETDEEAICRWSSENLGYDQMPAANEFPSASEATIMATINGTHDYYIKCRDYAYNIMSSPEIVTITYDDTRPPLLITYPDDGEVVNTTYLTVTGRSDVGVEITGRVMNSQSYDAQNILNTPADEEVSINAQAFQEDTISINLTSKLRLINNDETNYKIVLPDSSKQELPSGESLEIEFDAIGTYSYGLEFSGHRLASELDVHVLEVDNDFSLDLELPLTVNRINVTARNIQQNVRHKDFFVFYDVKPPTVVPLAPAAQTTVTDIRPTIRAEIADINSIDTGSIIMKINGKEVTENNGTLGLPPPDGGTVSFTPYFDLMEGLNNVQIGVADATGNYNVTSWSFRIDTRAPSAPSWWLCEDILIHEHDFLFNDSLCIEVRFNEEVNPVAASHDFLSTDQTRNKTYRYSGRFPEGSVEISIDVEDMFGNSGTYIRNFVIDKTAPIINDNTPTSATNAKSVRINGKVTEENLDTLKINGRKINYLPDNSYSEEYPLMHGLTSFVIEATDKAGQKAAVALAIESDQNPPTFGDFAAVMDGSMLEINFTASEALAAEPSVKIKGLGTALLSIKDNNKYRYTMSITGEQSGSYQLNISGEDLTGNWGSYQQQIGIDTIPPKFANSYPAEGHIKGGQNQYVHVYIEGDWSGINASSIRMKINNEQVAFDYNPITGKVEYYNSSMPDGIYTVLVGAEDNYQNYNEIIWQFNIQASALYDPIFYLNGAQAGYPNFIGEDGVNISILYNQEVTVDSIKLDSISRSGLAKINDSFYSIRFDPIDDGAHKLEINCHNSDMNENHAHILFTVDTVPPAITITSPQHNSASGDVSVLIEGEFLEENLESIKIIGDIIGGQLYLDDEINKPANSFAAEVLINGTDEVASKNITALITDKLGRTSQDSIGIIYDSRQPYLVAQISPLKQYNLYDGITSQPLHISGITNISSLVEVFINGVIKESTIASDGTFNFTVQLMSHNPNELNIVSTNQLGIKNTISKAIIYDNIKPDIVNPRPRDTTVLTTKPEIKATLSDNFGINSTSAMLMLDGSVVGMATGQYSVTMTRISYVPGTDITEGQHVVEMNVSDIAGNNRHTNDWQFAIDTSAPDFDGFYLCNDVPVPGYINNTKPCFLAKFNEDVEILQPDYFVDIDGSVFRYEVTDEKEEGRAYDLSVTARNSAGKIATYSIQYMIDTSAPVVSYIESEDYSTDASLNFSFGLEYSRGADVVDCYIMINDSTGSQVLFTATNTLFEHTWFGAQNNKTYYAHIMCVDAAGNFGEYQSTPPIKVDTQAPVVTSLQDSGLYSTGMLNFTFSAYDMETEIDICEIQIADNLQFHSPRTAELLPGTHLFSGDNGVTYYARVRCTDRAGNAATYTNPTDGLMIDISPPMIHSLIPNPNSIIGDRKPLVLARYMDLQSGVDIQQVQLLLDGVEPASYLINIDKIEYMPVTNLTVSDHELQLTITDNAGNTVTEVWSFVIDESAPSSPSIQPDGYVNNTPTISIQFSEPEINMTKISLNKGGDEIYSWPPMESSAFDAAISAPLDDGLYEVLVKARKMLETMEWGAEGTYHGYFTVDTTPPEITLDALPQISPELTIAVSGSCSDNTGLGDNDVYIYEDDLDNLLGWSSCSGGSFSTNVQLNEPDGNKTIIAVIEDLAGNVNSATEMTLLDRRIPSISILDIINNDIQYNPSDSYYKTNDETITIVGAHSYAELGINVDINGIDKSAFIEKGPEHFNITVDLPLFHGQEVRNNITITGTGRNQKTSSSSIIISTDLKGPEIVGFHPETYATSDRTPTIEIQTDESAACTLDYTPSSGLPDSVEFTSSDGLVHSSTIRFGLPTAYVEAGIESAVIIACQDSFGNMMNHTIILNVDIVAPTIIDITQTRSNYELAGSTATSRTYMLYEDPRTKLNILTNESTICKYDDLHTNFTLMENRFGDQYVSEHLNQQDLILEEGLNTYYIACADKAANVAATWTVNLHYMPIVSVIIMSPTISEYIFEENPVMSFLTNKMSRCSISSDQDIYLYDNSSVVANFIATDEGSFFRHTARLSASQTALEGLPDKTTYTITVECEPLQPDVEPNSFNLVFTSWYEGPNATEITII